MQFKKAVVVFVLILTAVYQPMVQVIIFLHKPMLPDRQRKMGISGVVKEITPH